MKVFTDQTDFAANYFPEEKPWKSVDFSGMEKNLLHLLIRLFNGKAVFRNEQKSEFWRYLFLVENAPASQYDVLIDLVRQNRKIPAAVLCLAGAGKNFHGFQNRNWCSLSGNIHLSAYVAPNKMIKNFASGFMIVAAVSVLQTLDAIPWLQGKPAIKWMNDIFIDDAKVSGVLAHTFTRGNSVTGAVLGIGVNVAASPGIEPTPFVPEAAALADFVPEKSAITQGMVFPQLLTFLYRNYQILLAGDYRRLLEIYRTRSLVIGRNISLWRDEIQKPAEKIAAGKVKSIGENLELYLEGEKTPYKSGRLVLES
ncbi:MAG TPA: hypothetical protein ENH29_04040 [Bacteroidetes bacterium]|nr:hypothetical protein [Bacteroidota bacterium]